MIFPFPLSLSKDEAAFSRTSLRRPVIYTGLIETSRQSTVRSSQVEMLTYGSIASETVRNHPSNASAAAGDQSKPACDVVDAL